MTFLDRTFCASPNCINECGRKMTEWQRGLLDQLGERNTHVSYGYFCDSEKGHLHKMRENVHVEHDALIPST